MLWHFLVCFFVDFFQQHFSINSFWLQSLCNFTQVYGDVIPLCHLSNTWVLQVSLSYLPNCCHLPGISAPTYSHKSQMLGLPNPWKSAEQWIMILFGLWLTWSSCTYRFVPEKEWNSGYIHVVLDKLLEHSLSTLGSAHIEYTKDNYIKLHTVVKQGHNKPFRKRGANISMQHVGGLRTCSPPPIPPKGQKECSSQNSYSRCVSYEPVKDRKWYAWPRPWNYAPKI